MNLFNNIYKGKKVFLTGHTGFKGSWMTLWLQKLGAEVIGYSLEPNTTPNHYSLLNLKLNSIVNDINNFEFLQKKINETNPEIIFHLAAQPIVRDSYKNPLETYKTNVIGTANLLEAVRLNGRVKAVVIITTDKVYENNEQKKAFKEDDRMGGYDPYSCSKGCAELVINSFRNSFFNLQDYKKTHNTLIVSARSGNVIGGGDWSRDRLIPDLVKKANIDTKTIIRNPNSVRPWQHVLEPLFGYLLLGQKLMEEKVNFAEAWNFGPEEKDVLKVEDVLKKSINYWDRIKYEIDQNKNNFHEAEYLMLNINKAKEKLGFKPRWSIEKSIEKTILWYKNYYEKGILNTEKDLDEYIN